MIFDLDGVLADSEPIHAQAWIDTVVKTYGKKLPLDLMATAIGTPDKIFAEKLRMRIGVAASPADFIHEKKRKFFESLRKSGLQAKPGALHLVERLRARRIPIAVASGSGRAEVGTSLRIMGLLPRLQFYLAHEDVAFRKPHPQIYLDAARRLRVPSSSCLVFEDSPTGLRSAWEAGCVCFGVLGSYPRPILKPAHGILDSLSEKGPLRPYLKV